MEDVEIRLGEMVFDARADGPSDGELVLLLHGFPQTSWAWRHVMPPLAAAGYRAVAPDQRGYSPRARPEGVEAYGTLELVGDVVGMADRLGADRFHLVGHDWGAAVAWQVAGRHPERLHTLTVLSVPHPIAFSAALASPDTDQAGRSSYVEAFRTEGSEELFVADGAAGLRNFYLATGLTDEDADVYAAALADVEAMRAALNWYRGIGPEILDGFGPVTTPTLFVWGADDPAIGRESAEATADHVEGPYRFEPLEGVGHWIPELAPDVLEGLLLAHLADLAPREPPVA